MEPPHDHADHHHCLRLRGLPFSTTPAQLLDWFSGYNVIDGLITRSDGKPNGQAFVLLPKAEALKAQVELNNKYMGKRFIEVFSSTVADMETARRMCAEQAKASGSSGGSTRSKQQSTNNLHIIRLRGLPFSATPADIKAFLAPIDLPDGINSIQMARHPDLRPTGEAYVHLSTETEVMQALNKHKQMMGKRYIEVFPSCLAELQQSMTPPRPACYQQPDQARVQMPTGNPAAQAAWLQRQQQLLQMQQQMQLQAAAQQKMLANLQQQRQHQMASLRVQAQLQAQAQALPTMLQQMQLNDINSSPQQPQQEVLVALPGLQGLNSPVQQPALMLSGLCTPTMSLPPTASVSSSGMSLPSAAGSAAAGVGGSGGVSSLSSNMASTASGLPAAYGMVAGPMIGGLNCTAAVAATATCSPSPLDVQYVPFFCSGSAAPMTALMLQDTHGLQASSLQMMSPSCYTGLSNLTSASNAQQQSVFASELFSSSANVMDSSAVAGGNFSGAVGAAAPVAFCSDPLLQGVGSGNAAGVPPQAFLRAQGLNRGDAQGNSQEWLM